MFSITFWVSPQCDTHLHVKNKLKEKKGIFFYVLVKQNKKREGRTVACFRGCHFSVTSGVLKVSRITHVYAQAVVKFWVLGSCPIFQLWKKVSSFIVTTSQLVSSVQTIVYAVSRKDLHSWKETYQKKHWCSQKECSHFASLRLMKSWLESRWGECFRRFFSRARMN